MSRCIITVGAGDWYPRGVERMRASLDEVGDTAERLFWMHALPSSAVSHRQLPYGFKIAALNEARAQGADSVLWLDASCWAVRSLDSVWKRLEDTGHLLMNCHNYLSQWSTDQSLATLGFQREYELKVPLVAGGMFGLRFSSPVGARFAERMTELAIPEVLCGDWKNDHGQCSSDSRVRGHRHDQVLMGYLAHDMALPLINQPEYFGYYTTTLNEKTVIVARGM